MIDIAPENISHSIKRRALTTNLYGKEIAISKAIFLPDFISNLISRTIVKKFEKAFPQIDFNQSKKDLPKIGVQYLIDPHSENTSQTESLCFFETLTDMVAEYVHLTNMGNSALTLEKLMNLDYGKNPRIIAEGILNSVSEIFQDSPEKAMTIIAKALFTGNLNEIKDLYLKKQGSDPRLKSFDELLTLPIKSSDNNDKKKDKLATLLECPGYYSSDPNYLVFGLVSNYLTDFLPELIKTKQILDKFNIYNNEKSGLREDELERVNKLSSMKNALHEFTHFLTFSFWKRNNFGNELSSKFAPKKR